MDNCIKVANGFLLLLMLGACDAVYDQSQTATTPQGYSAPVGYEAGLNQPCCASSDCSVGLTCNMLVPFSTDTSGGDVNLSLLTCYQPGSCQELQGMDGDCYQSADCSSGLICESDTRKCELPGLTGEACSTDSDCLSSLKCSNYVCAFPGIT